MLFRRLEGVLANSVDAQAKTFRMVTVSLPSSGEPIDNLKDEATVAAEVAARSGTAAIYGMFDADRTTVVDRCAMPSIKWLWQIGSAEGGGTLSMCTPESF